MSLEEDIKQLIEITGLDRTVAETLLKINDNNLQQAINYHLEADGAGDSEHGGDPDVIPLDSNGQPYRGGNDSVFNSVRDNGSSMSENASLPDYLGSSTSNGGGNSDFNHDSDNVRAPIPSKREQLILPEDDQFRYQHYSSGIMTRKRRAAAATFSVCPFRNFAREAEELEQVCNADPDSNDECSRSSNSNSIFHNNQFNQNRVKRKRLEDLFRPPSDILYAGTFQAARDHATNLNRWLIVNVQDNREFSSQILNRDIWPDKNIKDLIVSHFVLWQISIDNPEGFRFKTFYRVKEFPYVCILDPRTGEDKQTCDTSTTQIMYKQLIKFLEENLYGLDPLLLPKPKLNNNNATATVTATTTTATITSQSTSNENCTNRTFNCKINKKNDQFCDDTFDCSSIDEPASGSKKQQLMELTEEEQIELAIKNSLNEKSSNKYYDSDEDDDDDDDDTDAVSVKSGESAGLKMNHIASMKISNTATSTATKMLQPQTSTSCSNQMNHHNNIDEQIINKYPNSNSIKDKDQTLTKIQIRLPKGEKDCFEWPASTLLCAIPLYINDKYPEIAKSTYKLISPYPRKNILELNDQLTLMEAKLHPSTILYLHPDD